MLCNKWDAAFITDDKSAQGTVSAFAEAAEITDVDPLLLKFVNVRSSWMIAIWRHKSTFEVPPDTWRDHCAPCGHYDNGLC